MAAYQSLGPFISTFADPQISGFVIDEMGNMCKFEGPSVQSLGDQCSAHETNQQYNE